MLQSKIKTTNTIVHNKNFESSDLRHSYCVISKSPDVSWNINSFRLHSSNKPKKRFYCAHWMNTYRGKITSGIAINLKYDILFEGTQLYKTPRKFTIKNELFISDSSPLITRITCLFSVGAFIWTIFEWDRTYH